MKKATKKKAVKKVTKKPLTHYLEVDKDVDKVRLNKLIESLKTSPTDIVKIIFTEDLTKTPPSQVTSTDWIKSIRKTGVYPKLTSYSGKWLIFRGENEIDKTWDKVKIATETGLLGHSSKVSTKKAKQNSKYDNGVICIYTYDWRDEKDVTRIREELRKLGVMEKIHYKADQDTRDGKYATGGQSQLSKYSM